MRGFFCFAPDTEGTIEISDLADCCGDERKCRRGGKGGVANCVASFRCWQKMDGYPERGFTSVDILHASARSESAEPPSFFCLQ